MGCIPSVEECVRNCSRNIEMLKAVEEGGFKTDQIMAKPLRVLIPSKWGGTREMPTPSLQVAVRNAPSLEA